MLTDLQKCVNFPSTVATPSECPINDTGINVYYGDDFIKT